MEGWRLKRGDLLLEHKSDIEIWMHFNYFFSEQSKKRNTYKYGLLKSILDSLTLCNSASNYSLDFDVVFEKFTKNYWTIVLKYQLLTVCFPLRNTFSVSEEYEMKGPFLCSMILSSFSFEGSMRSIWLSYEKFSQYSSCNGRCFMV